MARANTDSNNVSAADEALIALAISALSKIPASDENHTVAAACRSAKTGKIFVGVNVDHFTGGPCAELVVLGTAAANGVLASEIGTMVAVVRRTGKPITVINPCGRCRQVMMDYNPAIDVLVLDESQGPGVKGIVKKAKAQELLPFAYVWPDGNTGQSSTQTLEGGEGADEDGKDV